MKGKNNRELKNILYEIMSSSSSKLFPTVFIIMYLYREHYVVNGDKLGGYNKLEFLTLNLRYLTDRLSIFLRI